MTNSCHASLCYPDETAPTTHLPQNTQNGYEMRKCKPLVALPYNTF
jgi:hypothetical protein